MADLAAKFPDKIFFAAAGNPTEKYKQPNILGAKDELLKQGKWPSNLFMIGYFGIPYENNELPSGYGADYYIHVDDLDILETSHATSYSTPTALRVVTNYLKENDIAPTAENVHSMLDKNSQIKDIGDVWDDTTKQTYEDQSVKIVNLTSLKAK